MGLKPVQGLAQLVDTDEGLSAELATNDCAEETKGESSQLRSDATCTGGAG